MPLPAPSRKRNRAAESDATWGILKHLAYCTSRPLPGAHGVGRRGPDQAKTVLFPLKTRDRTGALRREFSSLHARSELTIELPQRVVQALTGTAGHDEIGEMRSTM